MPEDASRRSVLPIPDKPVTGLITYDAKDPDTSFPPIETLVPPEGAPNVLVDTPRRHRVRRLQRLRRARQHARGRASLSERAEVQPVPHDGALCPHPRRDADGPQPPFGRHGLDHRDRYFGARQQRRTPQYEGTGRAHPQTERLQHGPASASATRSPVADLPDGTVRCVAGGRRRVRVLLRVHRRREQSVLPGALRGPDPGRAAEDPGGGLPPHRGPRRPRHRVDPDPARPHPRQAVLHVLRARRDARAPPRAEGVGRQVPRASSPTAGTDSASSRSRGRRSSG